MAIQSIKAIITGKVQGVSFRAWTCKEAHKLEINGWVRNRSDGSVEAVFSGEASQVRELLQACYEGPPMAKVESVTATGFTGEVKPGFLLLPTSNN